MKLLLATVAILVFSAFYSEENTVVKQSAKHAIGEDFGGGIVFYLDGTGEHGLIAAETDLKKAKWYNGSFVESGATGTGVGTGKQNTEAVVKAQGAGEYAAKICDALELNGFSDWFLPSKDELNLLREKRKIVGGFDGVFYWSSTEYNSHYAWAQNINNGLQNYGNKNSAPSIRPIRAF